MIRSNPLCLSLCFVTVKSCHLGGRLIARAPGCRYLIGGEHSSLLTRIATKVGALLSMRMKVSRFLELESAIRVSEPVLRTYPGLESDEDHGCIEVSAFFKQLSPCRDFVVDFVGQVENHLDVRLRTRYFLECETFSLISQKGVNGHQRGQVEFADGYLSLLEPRWRFQFGFSPSGFTIISGIE